MPLEWKLTTIGKTGITHWKQHNPKKLLESLSRPAILEIGKHPRVRVHEFGRLHLAVREFEPFSFRYNSGERSFEILRELAKQRAAFVEMPVALIQRTGSNPVVITIWKKNTIGLDEFLKSGNVSDDLKERACLNAARQTARLHAKGFLHGHLKVENFLVDKNGNSQLVDYTLLRQEKWNLDHLKQIEIIGAIEGIVACRYPSSLNRYGEAQDALALRMKKEYVKEKQRI